MTRRSARGHTSRCVHRCERADVAPQNACKPWPAQFGRCCASACQSSLMFTFADLVLESGWP